MELTPRVGDRVIFKTHGRTHVGEVDRFDVSQRVASVLVPYWSQSVWIDPNELTVVDRDIRWPEGWTRSSAYPNCVGNGAHIYERYELESILATGPEMLARWDELMGEQ